MSIGPEHFRALRQETVVSIAINAFIPAGVIWIVDAVPPQTLVAQEPLVRPMLAAAGLATLMMTLVLTLIVRARVRAGGLPALDWPFAERGAMRWIPTNLVLRAVTLGILAIVLIVPLALVIMKLSGSLPFDRVTFLVFNLVYGAIVGLVMAPFVVLPALADQISASTVKKSA